jgi:hypothetical protein
MTKLEIALQKLIDKEGFDETKSILGLSTMELIQKSDCRIDLIIANDIITELFDLGAMPKSYKNCKLSEDVFGGFVEWWCDWSDSEYGDYESEETISYATPFWDGGSGVPVNTNSYEVTNSEGRNRHYTEDNIGSDKSFSFIKWDDEFENLASYSMWVRRFYLPKVYSVIKQHLDNYRNNVD